MLARQLLPLSALLALIITQPLHSRAAASGPVRQAPSSTPPTLAWREGRSVYSAAHSGRPHCRRRSAASTSRMPEMASPTAWLMASLSASSSRAAALSPASCAEEWWPLEGSPHGMVHLQA